MQIMPQLIWLEWDQGRQRSLSKRQRKLDVSQLTCPDSNHRRDFPPRNTFGHGSENQPCSSCREFTSLLKQATDNNNNNKKYQTILPVSNPKLGTMSTVP